MDELTDSSGLLGDRRQLSAVAAESGYLFLRQFLAPQLVLGLRNRVLKLCAEFGWLDPGAPVDAAIPAAGVSLGAYDAPWVALQQRLLITEEFTAVAHDPSLLDLMQVVIGGPVEWDCGNTCRLMSPHAPQHTTPPHQDAYYVRGTTKLWTAWVPLGDCPAELGGLAVVAGSHRAGLLDHRGQPPGAAVDDHGEFRWATVDYRVGDVLIFSGLTLHRALVNQSRQLRISADFRYQRRRQEVGR